MNRFAFSLVRATGREKRCMLNAMVDGCELNESRASRRDETSSETEELRIYTCTYVWFGPPYH